MHRLYRCFDTSKKTHYYKQINRVFLNKGKSRQALQKNRDDMPTSKIPLKLKACNGVCIQLPFMQLIMI